MSHQLDEDDRFLIRTLACKGLSPSGIAKKRDLNITVIQKVLQEFERKASQCVKNKEIQQAAFYFFQHKKYILNGADYAKLNFALKKCELEYPKFGTFLRVEAENEKIKDSTKWEEVDKLWQDNFKLYQQSETLGYTLESKLGKDGGGLISIDVEEQHMDAVCKIRCNNGENLGAGCVVKIGDCVGILTYTDVLNTIEQCNQSIILFDKLDGTDISVKMQPSICFKTNSKIGVTFVACETSALTSHEIEPLTQMGAVKKNAPTYSYFHLAGKHKVQMQNKIIEIESRDLGYDGQAGEGCAGAPLYCQEKLIGISQGKKKQSDRSINLGIHFESIQQWIDKEFKIFNPGEEVLATWTDGFEYKAKIMNKTVKGYKVHYYEFGDTMEDQTVDKIKKISPTSQESSVTEESSTSSSSSSTTTTTTTTTLEAEGKRPIDEEDIFLINTMIQRGSNAKKIAEKLRYDESVIQKFMNIDEESFKVFASWLKDTLHLSKYIETFRAHGIDSVEKISFDSEESKIEVEKKLREMGLKSGAIIKIVNFIQAAKGYKQKGLNYPTGVKPGNARVSKIGNKPMPDNWQPSGSDKDLSDFFKKPNGDYSVGYACNMIQQGNLHESIQMKKGEYVSFYIQSTRHNRYFKITLTF